MSLQATRDTAPELRLRSALHALGLRYRVHVRPIPELRRTADIVFARARVAVFVDGCFWHSCPEHGTMPSSNEAWWAAKLSRNVTRDADTDSRLAAAGWLVVRVWEHEDPAAATSRVADTVRRRTEPLPSRGSLPEELTSIGSDRGASDDGRPPADLPEQSRP
jgi:DNA mismatch endonuclease, patch repair protein